MYLKINICKQVLYGWGRESVIPVLLYNNVSQIKFNLID